MRPLALILGLLPLILFSLLARLLPSGDIGIAALLAAVAAGAAIVAIRPVWPPKILSACSLVLFRGAGRGRLRRRHRHRPVAGDVGRGRGGIVMGLVILALIPVIPFTEQFARQVTPRAYSGSPTFKKINRVLSSAWGVAIAGLGISRVIAAAIHRGGGSPFLYLVFSAAVPVVILVYMLKFSKSYPDRVNQGSSPGRASTPAA